MLNAREIRLSKGIGLREMARRLDVDPATLMRFEKGDRYEDGLDFARRYALELGVSIDDLLKLLKEVEEVEV